jgi:hypothetical protein
MRNIFATATFVTGLLTFAAPSQAALVYGSNVIINGDAEADVGNNGTSFAPPSGWTNSSATDGITVVHYGAPGGYPLATDPGPTDRGLNFFGGTITNPSAFITQQLLDVSNAAAAINAGQVTFDLSAYLGGYLDQDDNATFAVSFKGVLNSTLGTVTLGPVTLADRGGVTELLLRTASGTIPVGTLSLLFTLTSTRYEGANNDGYADNLSFIANGPTANPGATPLPAALPLFAAGAGVIGLLARRRKRKTAA